MATAVLAAGPARAAEPAGSAAAPGIVRLPEFKVNERLALRPVEKDWRHGQIGNFEILSNASEKETKRFIREFYQFHQVFTLMFPAIKEVADRPVTLVLCGAHDRYDQFQPLGTKPAFEAGLIGSASLSLHDADQSVIVIDLEARSLQIGAATDALPSAADVGGGGGDGSQDGTAFNGGSAGGPASIDIFADQVLYREYIHFIFGQSEPRAPAWLEEGIASILSSIRILPKTIEFGKLDPQFAPFLDGRGLLKMGALFAVGYDSPEYLNPVGSTFSAQSLAFVHLCLYGWSQQYQKPFIEFVQRSMKEPVTEALFRSCFKLGYRDMGILIRSYVQEGKYRHYVFKTGELPLATAPELRPATEAEVGRIKGAALRLLKRTDDAYGEIISPIVRGRPDARLYASAGFLAKERGQDETAQLFFERAVDAGIALPGPYLYLARSRLAGDLAVNGSAEHLTLPETAMLLSLLFKAREEAAVPRPDIYGAIADVWAHSPQPPSPENLGVLDEGRRLFPDNPELAAKTAALKKGLAAPTRSAR